MRWRSRNARKEANHYRRSDPICPHREGILNHCDYAIHTSRLEGINNTIKVIKRKAYGFRDDRYFTLKVKQAFDPKDVT